VSICCRLEANLLMPVKVGGAVMAAAVAGVVADVDMLDYDSGRSAFRAPACEFNSLSS